MRAAKTEPSGLAAAKHLLQALTTEPEALSGARLRAAFAERVVDHPTLELLDRLVERREVEPGASPACRMRSDRCSAPIGRPPSASAGMSSDRSRSGEPDRKHVDAVIEVLAKATVPDRGFEIGVGRRDDPHVHLAIGRRPDAADLALLEHPQEPDLHRGAHLADLVEEDRAPVGLLDPHRRDVPIWLDRIRADRSSSSLE